AGHAGASPVPLPVCDVSDSGVFLSYVMELFLMLLLFFSLLL
ncbi:transporter, partial [Escherichia coli]|nr:transporter [Escherichia coli]